MTSSTTQPKIPLRDVLVRAMHPPLRDRRFWLILVMVVVWAAIHIVVDLHENLGGNALPYGLPIDLLLIPVGFAALYYGLSGSAATMAWALLVWSPDTLLHHRAAHLIQDLVQLGIVTVVALFVGAEIERTHLERSRAEAAEAERREAELHYHRLFDSNASPIVLLDVSNKIAEANPAAEALWGDVVGRSIETILNISSEQLVEGRSTRMITPADHSGVEHVYRISVARLGSPTDSLRQVVLEDITEEFRSETEARAWATEVLNAQEQERRKIAREIHDDPLQRLLQLARRMADFTDVGESDTTGAPVDEVRTELLGVVDHLRDVTRGLHPAGLDQYGLTTAIRGMLMDIEIADGISTRFEVTGTSQRGSSEVEVGTFRIIQEATRNAIQHARAENLTVRLNYGDDEIHFAVADDGVGFNTEQSQTIAQSHLGLDSMRERAHLLGGVCDIHSTVGLGTLVEGCIGLHGVGQERHGAVLGQSRSRAEL